MRTALKLRFLAGGGVLRGARPAAVCEDGGEDDVGGDGVDVVCDPGEGGGPDGVVAEGVAEVCAVEGGGVGDEARLEAAVEGGCVGFDKVGGGESLVVVGVVGVVVVVVVGAFGRRR